jgi:hypothetical protein
VAETSIPFLAATPTTDGGTQLDVDPRIVNGIVLRAISDDSPREMAMLAGLTTN